MTEAATLIFSITGLISVLLIGAIVVIGLWKPHLLKRIKFRFKDFEGEFEPGWSAPNEAPKNQPAVATAVATEQPPLSATASVETGASMAPQESQTDYDLLKAGKYEEGLQLLRQQNVPKRRLT